MNEDKIIITEDGEEVDPENLNWSQDADRVEVR